MRWIARARRRLRTWRQLVAMDVIERVSARKPDFLVGPENSPYLRRWWLIPRNRLLNAYFHEFLRDDDDRALHDHPWFWCSIIIAGGYIEHSIAAGGIHIRKARAALSIRFGTPWSAHRVELFRAPAEHGDGPTMPCWTVFITGPRMRNWGFHCPAGWVPWQRFTDPADSGRVGPGCDDQPVPLRTTALQRALAADFARDEAEVESRAIILTDGSLSSGHSPGLGKLMQDLARGGRMEILHMTLGGCVIARWINPEAPPSMVRAGNDNTPADAGKGAA